MAFATFLVVAPGAPGPSHSAQSLGCPELVGGSQVYCENVSVPEPNSGEPCSVGANASGIFHSVSYTFQRYFGCGPLIIYGINGTVEEPSASPQHFDLNVGPPALREWSNYTSPDGLVFVAWQGLNLNVTLAVET